MYVWMFAGQSKKKNNQLTKLVHSLWNLAVTKALVEALLAAASDDGLGPPGAPVPAFFALVGIQISPSFGEMLLLLSF